MSLINSTAIPSGASAYEIEQSLRFNDDDESRLVRTPTSNGNQRTFTLSVWVKRGNHTLGTDQEQDIIGAFYASNASRYSYIAFNDTDGIIIFGGKYSTSGTTQSFYRRTQAKYRDSSAWYHIVWRHDSTDGTATNRDRLYVNGVLQDWDTSLSTDLVCGQNEYSYFNYTTSPMTIGEYASTNTTSTMEFDGYMAEMHWIDGTSVAVDSFGETGDYGEWKPIEYSGSYGTNGFYLNFAGGGIISSATGGNSTGTTGDYKYKTYTSNGTFTPGNDGFVEYLVVGGGGGGGSRLGGGGGGGGFKTGFVQLTGSTAYSVAVGAGGAYDASGSNSSISGTGVTTITATGGGTGGAGNHVSATGGSGGGGAGITSGNTDGSAGTSGQGNAGGDGAGSSGFAGGGGGGAGAVGADGPQSGKGGDGGAGLQSNIDTNNYYYSGGGGGGAHFDPSTGAGNGGIGGGGGGARGGGSTGAASANGNGTGGGSARNSGGSPADAVNQPGGAGGTNTGGGGGGAPNNADAGGAGGSGIVIIRYKFQ